MFYRIWRDAGTFGEVEVSWEIIDVLTNKILPDGSEFEKSNGTVLFPEGSMQQTLTIFPRSDDAPEKERVYTIRLHAVTGSYDTTDIICCRIISTFCSLFCFAVMPKFNSYTLMIHFYFWSLTLTINFSFTCINCDILSFESNSVQPTDSTILASVNNNIH